MSDSPPDTPQWSTGELARVANVTARTLHHYDQTGLLRPHHRTEAGYRVYRRPELERLHLIRLYRSAGVPLDTIRALLDDPDFDRIAALQQHLARMDAALERQQQLRAALHALLEQETAMSPKKTDATDLFAGFDPEDHEAEARQRWGDSRAWKVSQRRTQNRSPEAWARRQAESAAIEAALADAMSRGVASDATEAMDLAERHRQHITDWFYPCSHEVHVGLAEMYVADPRFTKHYNKRAPGLAEYLSDAIFANAAARV